MVLFFESVRLSKIMEEKRKKSKIRRERDGDVLLRSSGAAFRKLLFCFNYITQLSF